VNANIVSEYIYSLYLHSIFSTALNWLSLHNISG